MLRFKNCKKRTKKKGNNNKAKDTLVILNAKSILKSERKL